MRLPVAVAEFPVERERAGVVVERLARPSAAQIGRAEDLQHAGLPFVVIDSFVDRQGFRAEPTSFVVLVQVQVLHRHGREPIGFREFVEREAWARLIASSICPIRATASPSMRKVIVCALRSRARSVARRAMR
jgi:hypothetical protein